jgi:hypothetical protein
LLLVPHMFFTESIVKKRKSSNTARRLGGLQYIALRASRRWQDRRRFWGVRSRH